MTTVETLLQGFSIRSDQGTLGFCGVSLLRDGGRTILVDVGHVGRRTLLLDRLKERGVSPTDVDAVVLTHAHWDHCLNVDLFPNARVLLSAREHEYARRPHELDWATPPWTGMVLDRHPVQEVRDGEEIADGVRIMEVPGHSPGSIAVLVRTPDGVTGIVGDALPNAASVAAGICYLVFWNEEEARRSVSRIVDACDIVYPGHDRAFRLQGGSFTYIEPTRIGFSGLPETPDGMIGATFSVEAPRAIGIMPCATPAGASTD
jgi:N-acyl homoserine lactone hydrolase